jgi:hypothetical protein
MTHVRVTLSLLAVILAFAKSAPGQSNWSVFTAQRHGFSIELPGTPQEEPGKPGQFILQSGGFTFIAEASELESSVFQLVASRDRKNIAMMLEAIRDASAKGMNAPVRDSSSVSPR